jgi:hypothetical protein
MEYMTVALKVIFLNPDNFLNSILVFSVIYLTFVLK